MHTTRTPTRDGHSPSIDHTCLLHALATRVLLAGKVRKPLRILQAVPLTPHSNTVSGGNGSALSLIMVPAALFPDAQIGVTSVTTELSRRLLGAATNYFGLL